MSSSQTKGCTLRFQSFYGRYLVAMGEHFLLALTDKKVMQDYLGTVARLDSSLKWEPLRKRFQVKLTSGASQFLCANGSIPPWKNSVTHDLRSPTAPPLRTRFWNVDITQS
ncbi:hypothetical protein Cni_G26120 [Canna indica]|uniref:DUF569 domain-containing protein n=1 Tax=Canna indica TaxID=4628 RepID=A0AAQ3KYV7_9LILI|nr:hypothetical protein Cni_G26120 [Canna indica]